jgi:shikimate kinase / 3-dehydroquinate synthase
MSERVFLSGPMGSGKSHVAQAVGELWHAPAVDLDKRIEHEVGMSITELWKRKGEAQFREIERSTLKRVLDAGVRIVALGGGTVTDRTTRRELLRQGTLVTLRAPLDTLVQRVGSGHTRPLLAGTDIRARLAGIIEERAEAYAECHGEIDTDGRDVTEIALDVDRMVSDAPIVVPLGLRTYRVHVAAGARHSVAEQAARVTKSRTVLVATDTGVEEPWARRTREALEEAGFKVHSVCIPQGEENKNLASVEKIWDAALGAGLDRDALVLAVGGGVLGDMAAFAASTILRGIAVAQLPTTLLSMVDSAVGGKTGIDRAQGKNLIGSFHQPRFVLCDVETLTTLPQAERRAGLAEVVKSAWLDGEGSVQLLERNLAALAAGELAATAEAVRMSVELKARIVTEDEHETGVRALLNLGHTVGHAIEAASEYKGLRHGEAVSLGMVAAFRLSRRLGVASADDEARMHALLSGLGLPTEVDGYLDDKAFSFLGSDKKRKGGKVRFIVPKGPGETQIVPLASEEIRALVVP